MKVHAETGINLVELHEFLVGELEYMGSHRLVERYVRDAYPAPKHRQREKGLVVKPHGNFTQVGMPDRMELTVNALALATSRVNFNASLIGGMPETQEVVHYCADNGIRPRIELIGASRVNEAWAKVVNKEARYRFVIDAATF